MKENVIKVKDFLLKNLKWIILFITLVLFLMIVEDVMDEEIMSTDSKGYALISTYLMSEPMTHGWFTNRAQVVSILASFSVLIESINITKIKEISAGRIR